MANPFTVGSGNAGGSPFLALLSGLSQGYMGYEQGRQMKLDREKERVGIQNEKLAGAGQEFDLLSKFEQAGGSTAGFSPEMTRAAQSQFQGVGMNLPMTTDGHIDPNIFKPPISSIVMNKDLSDRFYDSEPNSDFRRQMLANVGGSPEERQRMLTEKRQISEARRIQLQGHMDALLRGAAQGVYNPADPAFINSYNAYAKDLEMPPLAASSPTAHMGAQASAKLDLTRAQAHDARERGDWIKPLAETLVASRKASTALAQTRNEYIPKDYHLRQEHLTIAQRHLDNEGERLKAQLKTVYSPQFKDLTFLSTVADRITRHTDSVQKQLQAAMSLAAIARGSGQAVDPAMDNDNNPKGPHAGEDSNHDPNAPLGYIQQLQAQVGALHQQAAALPTQDELLQRGASAAGMPHRVSNGKQPFNPGLAVEQRQLTAGPHKNEWAYKMPDGLVYLRDGTPLGRP